MSHVLVPRRAGPVARESLAAFRVLVIHGARQVGKSTLARQLGDQHGATIVSLDSAIDRAAAVADPETFLAAHGRPLVIDEIQRAGEPLVLAVKAVVDLDNTPGQYVLTGSSNFLTVPGTTYQPWLKTVFLIHRVPAWSRNLTAKVVKRPKIHMVDTGVAAGLLGRQPAALRMPTDPAAGPLVETFAVNELAKQLTWCETFARLFHYRDRDGFEVDAVLESDDGGIVAVEVKTTSTPRAEDFRGVVKMRDAIDQARGRFVAGVVLHTGSRRLLFGDRLVALPLADLWT